MLKNYFINYETIKLPISSPNFNYLLIIGVFLFLSIITIRRVKPTQLLDKLQSNQLKGIGIIFVIFAHLWTHVSAELPATIILVGSVFLFLFLSGYGLTLSLNKQILTYKNYFKHRIVKIMIPYWFATLIILFLDYILLDKVYLFKDIIATFLGINISPETRYIDYVRWYLTFQLFWYIIFFIFNKYMPFIKTIVFLAIYALAGTIFSQITGLGSGFELAFPLGCLIAKHNNEIKHFFEKKTNILIISAILLIVIAILNKIFLINYNFKDIIFTNPINKILHFIAKKGISNVFNSLFTFAFIILIGAIGKKGYISRFLDFCGILTYELFLLHGCFLIKYNFIFQFFSIKLISVAFLIYFFIILIIAYYFHKLLNKILLRI
jgi:hypothetical protein